MSRRHFLSLVGGGALAACTRVTPATIARSSPGGSNRIRAVAFDLFTLFDPRGVDARVSEILGNRPDFARTWKSKLFEYSWLRAAAGRYRDFEGLAHDALLYAGGAHHTQLSAAALARLEAAFVELELWPDSKTTLMQLRERGLRLAPLANFSPSMIKKLLSRASIIEHFDDLISTDRAQTYKPDPRAYALAEASFGLSRSQIAFAAFGSWDAAGGRWFGFPTFWVNRLSQLNEQLEAPDASGPDLGHLLRWLDDVGAAASGTKT